MNKELTDSWSWIFLIALANKSKTVRTFIFWDFFRGMVSVTAISSIPNFLWFHKHHRKAPDAHRPLIYALSSSTG